MIDALAAEGMQFDGYTGKGGRDRSGHRLWRRSNERT